MPEDHPRRCGENLLMWLARGRQQGSPPQVRGKLSHTSPALISSRITPAGAGKTPQVTLVPIEDKDHPRRCGENPTRWRPTNLQRGSPPQVRGKLCRTAPYTVRKRITPAGAGKTLQKAVASGSKSGSPPQVRGKRKRWLYSG